MKISQLINLVGDENARIQNLDTCFVSANAGKKSATITFGTEREQVIGMLNGKSDDVCLIVWLPRDRVKAVMETKEDTEQ